MSTLMFGRVEAATSSQLFLCNSFVSTCGISLSFFFFNDTATTEIYTLSLHDALPIFLWSWARSELVRRVPHIESTGRPQPADRKSTRLNSSHQIISYAVFCLKKKKGPQLHLSGNPEAATHDPQAQPAGFHAVPPNKCR